MENLNLTPGKDTVTYKSDGFEIATIVHLSQDYKNGEKRPCVVFTRPGSGVKEQTAGVYAEALAKHGFVTLAFDPRGFGDTPGHEGVEDPFAICENTKNSVSFVRPRQSLFETGKDAFVPRSRSMRRPRPSPACFRSSMG